MRLAQLARLMLWMPLSLSAPRTLLDQWARLGPLRTLARRAQLALLVRGAQMLLMPRTLLGKQARPAPLPNPGKARVTGARLAMLPQVVQRGARPARLARLRAKMALRAQLALMRATGDSTTVRAPSALPARMALLPQAVRRYHSLPLCSRTLTDCHSAACFWNGTTQEPGVDPSLRICSRTLADCHSAVCFRERGASGSTARWATRRALPIARRLRLYNSVGHAARSASALRLRLYNSVGHAARST